MQQFRRQVEATYQEGIDRQPPGWEDSPEVDAEIEKLGGLSPYGQASVDTRRREDRLQRDAGRSPDHGRDRGVSFDR